MPTLPELLHSLQTLQNDPLAHAGTNIVISRGNPQARILLVGEAPGPQEDKIGKPFVGPAGQMLDKVLQAGGFDPEQDVYIINSVFRMPPGEAGKNFRKPNDAEIDFYRPFVFSFIEICQPLIILLTGNVASQSVLGKTGITSLRGQWFQVQGHWTMPIFHPSYLLRNPSKAPGSPKSLMWTDIQEVKRKFDSLQ
jgi:DNA polymerase